MRRILRHLPLVPLVPLVLLPIALFLALFHPATLDISNAGWLIRGTDNGENALGFHAYLHDATAGASLKTTLLNAPEGVPVLFTDSNPLLTLLAKPFAGLLPADAQFVGPFILLCLILQTIFAWALLRRYAPTPLALWIGVVLLAFPPTLANRYVHVNLMAHWTILAALLLLLDERRGRRLGWWAPLIAVTALIHSYLLVMVGAIWASAMLDRFVRGPARERLAVLGQGAAILALVCLIAWWLGVGGQRPAGNYGAFSMPLDALWNPGLQAYSRLLPAHEQSAGRGFEGFQYLGAGGILLVLAAIAVAWKLPARDGERAVAEKLRILVPALVVLTILAIARLPLPQSALAALDSVRASGRLFWPVGYVLILMAIFALYRLPPERVGLALTAVLALQVVDVSSMAHAIHGQTREAGERRLYLRTQDPRWDALVAAARDVTFVPAQATRDLSLFQEVAWRAASQHRPIRLVYAARDTEATHARHAAEDAAFLHGELDPHRLYVLLPEAPVPTAARSRLIALDGIRIIVPAR